MSITVEANIKSTVEKVWEYWTKPEHITKWCFASTDWEAPNAENDLRIGGKFMTRMSAKDKSVGFDFGGVYTDVKEFEYIAYVIGDGRKVEISFATSSDGVLVKETFDPETENPIEMQRAGWQAILDNFKKYAESFN
jgi:uncharacterized protein YndB with AHSA1/START domain